MIFKLPSKYKWKTRKRLSDKWSYTTSRELAVKYAGVNDHRNRYIKRVRKGT